MVAWLSSHKLLGSVIGIALAIIGLGGLPDDILTWMGWVENSASWLSGDVGRWLVLAFGVAIVVLVNADRIPTFSSRVSDEELAQLVNPPEVVQQKEEEQSHLVELARHDLASPTSMLKIMKRRVLKWNFEARRPAIAFGITVFNGNVYDLLLSPATGTLTYKGQQLEVAILPDQGGTNMLPRGQEYEIKVEQYVPDDLKVEAFDEISRGRIQMFGWSGISVNVKSDHLDAPGEGTKMTVGDGDGFAVED